MSECKNGSIKVLLADDSEGYRYPLANILGDNDYEVLEAESVEEAKKFAREADIWIIDVRLPSGKEGIEVVKKLIKDIQCKPRYDIIFISVLPEEDCEAQLSDSQQIGFNYKWLEKPFEPEYLLHVINEMVD